MNFQVNSAKGVAIFVGVLFLGLVAVNLATTGVGMAVETFLPGKGGFLKKLAGLS
jgi:hypothetical protein